MKLKSRESDVKKSKQSKNGERPVLVTTAHRGVFFGYAKDVSGETITLRAARLCVYWTSDIDRKSVV